MHKGPARRALRLCRRPGDHPTPTIVTAVVTTCQGSKRRRDCGLARLLLLARERDQAEDGDRRVARPAAELQAGAMMHLASVGPMTTSSPRWADRGSAGRARRPDPTGRRTARSDRHQAVASTSEHCQYRRSPAAAPAVALLADLTTGSIGAVAFSYASVGEVSFSLHSPLRSAT